MKYILLVILAALAFPSVGQDIEKVIFISQQADEPPTKQGRPKYTIVFNRPEGEELSASGFLEGKKRRRLIDKLEIDIDRAEKVTGWEQQDKRSFSQLDLGLDMRSLNAQANNHQLNFDLPTDFIVDVDSFQFCQPYRITNSISIGGEIITVTLIYTGGLKREFIFDSNGEGKFDLKDYILCYTLLEGKIPIEIPSYGFFSKSKFTGIVFDYQKTVECEGYYYKEFIEKNPTMTSKDRRMMTGWNFAEYLDQRNKRQ